MANENPVSESRVVYWVLFVIGLIAFVLLVVGLVTPAWLVLDYNDLPYISLDLKFSMGLWYVTYCFSGICESKDLNEFWETTGLGIVGIFSPLMTEYRVEAIISVVTIIVVMACLFKITWCSPNGIYTNSKGLWIVMCVCSAISAICALTAAGKYGRNIAAIHTPLEATGRSPYKLPYSIVVEGVGGILAGLFFIIIVIDTCRAMNRIDSANQPQTHYMTPYPSGAQPYAAQPYGGQPYGGQPYAGQPYAGQPYAGQPYGDQPYGGQAYNGPPPNSVPYGNQPDYNRYENPSHSYSGISESKQYPYTEDRGQSRRY